MTSLVLSVVPSVPNYAFPTEQKDYERNGDDFKSFLVVWNW